ncbi:c-type cytochrome [Herbaspirillum sp. C7C8]|jgi:cytochrome c553|uniref:c-type cytochrome n=1 Tax=Herbaspirillum sp. C7C8 TaxID=2736665 RepID=UPI001F516832|nr:c-type cytochrome [Herbaspirillum sp. C7C8]MCI1003745.1 c-type cytochrome [Herbaspirillum sp. C7C8]
MKKLAVTALGTWMTAGLAMAQPTADKPGTMPGMAERMAACIACHGKQGRATADGYYPRIAGKPEGYLLNQLQSFRDGRRRYPMMNYLLGNLSDDYLRQIAAFFADQHPPYPPPVPADAGTAVLDRGRLLVSQGKPTQGIAACASCHGVGLGGVQPGIPGLLGLPHDYINAQLGAWRNGERTASAPDCMGKIARALSPEDINAVSSWLSSQPVPADYAPARSLPQPLPVACGSMPPGPADAGAAR